MSKSNIHNWVDRALLVFVIVIFTTFAVLAFGPMIRFGVLYVTCATAGYLCV